MAARPKRDEALARPAPPHDHGSVLDPDAVIRAFVAFDVDAATLAAAARTAERVRSGPLAGARASWVHPARMHVTVRFLGDVEASVAARLGDDVERLGGQLTTRLELRATTLGAFTNPGRANVLTVSLEVPQAARELAEEVEAAAVAAGLAREGRPWVPHLTLARFRQPVDVRDVVRTTPLDLEGWATALTLYRSTLGAGGPTYEAVARAVLPVA